MRILIKIKINFRECPSLDDFIDMENSRTEEFLIPSSRLNILTKLDRKFSEKIQRDQFEVKKMSLDNWKPCDTFP